MKMWTQGILPEQLGRQVTDKHLLCLMKVSAEPLSLPSLGTMSLSPVPYTRKAIGQVTASSFLDYLVDSRWGWLHLCLDFVTAWRKVWGPLLRLSRLLVFCRAPIWKLKALWGPLGKTKPWVGSHPTCFSGSGVNLRPLLCSDTSQVSGAGGLIGGGQGNGERERGGFSSFLFCVLGCCEFWEVIFAMIHSPFPHTHLTGLFLVTDGICMAWCSREWQAINFIIISTTMCIFFMVLRIACRLWSKLVHFLWLNPAWHSEF
jgi:hypothetical protein